MNKKRIFLISIIFLLLAAIIVIVSSNSKDKVVIKDNVNVIVAESENQPIKVTDDMLIFDNNCNYKKDDVIVAGIIDSATTGFIRRVVDITETNSQYIVKTENAYLTDVFKRAHIIATFEITVEEEDRAYLVANKGSKAKANELLAIEKVYADDTKKFGITRDIEYNFSKNLTVTGETGLNLWLESCIDIKHGNIEWAVALHEETIGKIAIICSGSDSEPFEETILSKRLKPIQFMAGEIPIVITNNLEVLLDGEVGISGSVGTTMDLSAANKIGFVYSSKTGKIEETFEKEYGGNGIRWNTEASAEGRTDCQISAELLTKLYDCTGAKLGAGVKNENTAQICVSRNSEDKKDKYVGKIDMVILPSISGDIVVDIPIIGENLVEMQLFEKDFEPLWEEHWKSSKEWSAEYEKNKPKEEWHQTYGNIIDDMKNYGSNSKVYFVGMYYAPSVTDTPDGRGGVTGGYQLNSGQLKYMLKDISNDKDGIPELFIGNNENGNYEILAIYSYDKASQCAVLVSSKDDEYNTFDIYLEESNLFYEGTYSGGQFIMLNGYERSPWSAWRTGQDEDRLVNTDTLNWNNLDTWN